MTIEKIRHMRNLENKIVHTRLQLKEDTEEFLTLFKEWYEDRGGNGNYKGAAYLRLHLHKNSTVLVPLGERIRRARKARKLTIMQAAELAGISYATMCKYEGGQAKPKKGKVLKVYPEMKGAKEWQLLELV